MPKTNSKKQPNVKKVAKKTVMKKVAPRKVVTKKLKEPKKQEMVSFGRAIANFFKGYFKFSGTAQRSEFWWVVLFNFLVGALLGHLSYLLSMWIYGTILPINDGLTWYQSLTLSDLWYYYGPQLPSHLWNLVIFIPMLTLTCRRFHDVGHSGKWLWLNLIYVVMVMSALILSQNGDSLIIALVLAILALLGSITWTIILFVWTLLPSKLNDNKYRD